MQNPEGLIHANHIKPLPDGIISTLQASSVPGSSIAYNSLRVVATAIDLTKAYDMTTTFLPRDQEV